MDGRPPRNTSCRELCFFPCNRSYLFRNIEMNEKHILLTHICSQPNRLENTGSRPITAVKLDWAELVLGCETA